MLTAHQLLTALTSGCAQLDSTELAEASVTAKREGLFRDLALRDLTLSQKRFWLRPEWPIPAAARSRWTNILDFKTEQKGFVDLVAIDDTTPLSAPRLAAEFKLWYWFDVLDERKYLGTMARYHHFISQSFIRDAAKLIAVLPDSPQGRLIVTVVPTFHLDELSSSTNPKLKKELIQTLQSLGVPYTTNVSGFLTYPISSSTDTRKSATDRLAKYFESKGCTSVIGVGPTGSYKGLRVSTDFVVTEIPTSAVRHF